VCGRGREPLPIEDGRRKEVPAEGDARDKAGLERAFEAFRNEDWARFVGHVLAADGGSTVRSVELEAGPGWLAVIRGAAVFTSIHNEAREITVEAPVVRLPRVQRVPVLRLALELSSLDLVGARFCLRDDLLILRFVNRLGAQNPIALRQVFCEISSLAARYTELFAINFEACPVIPEEQRSSADFDALGQTKRLRFGPGTNRANAHKTPSAVRRAPQAAPEAFPRPARPAEAPVKSSNSHIYDARPAMRSSSAPPPPIADDPNGLGTPRSAPQQSVPPPPESNEPRRSEVATTPLRRSSVIPGPPEATAARSSEPPPRPSRPGPAPVSASMGAGGSDASLSRRAEDHRRNAQTAPDPNKQKALRISSTPAQPAVRQAARPLLEIEAPSRRPGTLIPAVTGENALLPADRLAAMLRQAQTLASLTQSARPGSMSWLVRGTVFRAVYEYRDALPDAVAHLYRCIGIGQGAGEPALHVMERIAAARCQVPAEKPLTIDPFTTAPQAKDHVARYIVEIERCPSDPAFRHFLALGALSELLVRAKLPTQTEQRLREIVTFAQREGAKASAFDLMMTSLQRISGG
jgi:hypothetical protein